MEKHGIFAAALLVALALAGSASAQATAGDALPVPLLPQNSDTVLRGPLILDRGPGEQEVHFPRDEELEYIVSIDLGILGEPEVGRVAMTSVVRPFARPGDTEISFDEERSMEQALVSARARGEYQVYTLDETIQTRFQPVSFPQLKHESIQRGTENRRRELSLGLKDGVPTASYRNDGHCKSCKDEAHFVDPTFFWNDRAHCTGCKAGEHRIWKDPRDREIPAKAVDMVTAVMLARTVVSQGKASAVFTLVDRDRLWEVELSRGKRGRMKVSAGHYDVVEIVLKTRPPATETGREEDFQGLFGLHGNISIWMHPESGVPVLISGRIPAGPIELDVRIELDSARGTPPSFVKVIK
ncbi:MAG: DUF3108 domain-containing protein [Planctomycetota bacterium]|nr:DUF3108 domain-containing protein [Planctomycetota bacterium]